jgi:hypothetical protein
MRSGLNLSCCRLRAMPLYVCVDFYISAGRIRMDIDKVCRCRNHVCVQTTELTMSPCKVPNQHQRVTL